MDFLALYALALVSAGLVTFFSLPAWRWWCQRTGVVDDPGHRKIHATSIPLAGGLAVMTGLLLPVMAGLLCLKGSGWLDPSGRLLYGLSQRGSQLGLLLLGALGMVLLGGLDDKYELRPAVKFGGQFLIALLVALSGVRITLFVPNPIFSFAITIL